MKTTIKHRRRIFWKQEDGMYPYDARCLGSNIWYITKEGALIKLVS